MLDYLWILSFFVLPESLMVGTVYPYVVAPCALFFQEECFPQDINHKEIYAALAWGYDFSGITLFPEWFRAGGLLHAHS